MKESILDRVIEESMRNSESFEEFMGSFPLDDSLTMYFYESTGEYPNSKEELNDFYKEIWDDFTN